ncbi:COP9 signalosome complex subunit 2 [Histomonas meleagridis]|uniref:COP9 signalosome complex subunit 2 n=1 Tax=Histomonas meleagridis TaxID=135588 RepID=UPI00355A02E9|nr:COP9 signalosome complex subunit 2 [Histomonas meleagridis]KAH0805098.1 COP9 signalosome complex subunit 2 [Histomonas meleagridis]
MSDEEIYFDEEDAGNEEAYEGEVYQGGAEEEQAEYTPEGTYRAAKESVGFDDPYAVDLFYQVFQDPNADAKLRSKSLLKAAVIQSNLDDTDLTIECLNDVFQANADKLITNDQLQSTVSSMLANVIRNETTLLRFLDTATELVDQSTMGNLYLDLKLRQCEYVMRNQDYTKGKEILSEIEPYVTLPPDLTDPEMCNIAIRILSIRIELADARKDLESMFNDYKLASTIPSTSLNDRQSAVLLKIEGIQLLKERKPQLAYQKFYESFRLFDNAGSDQRIDCLMLCALSQMWSKGSCGIFLTPEAIKFRTNAKVAPIDHLADYYEKKDIVKFREHIDTAQGSLGNLKLYNDIIEQIRKFVLRSSISVFCQNYSRVEVKYVASQLKSDVEEVRKLVYDLILAKDMNALIDYKSDIIVMQKEFESSILLAGIREMIEAMERNVKNHFVALDD